MTRQKEPPPKYPLLYVRRPWTSITAGVAAGNDARWRNVPTGLVRANRLRVIEHQGRVKRGERSAFPFREGSSR